MRLSIVLSLCQTYHSFPYCLSVNNAIAGFLDVPDGFIFYSNMYPLAMTNSLLLKMATEMVNFLISSMVIFHSYENVYQRVSMVTNVRKTCHSFSVVYL